MTQRLSGDAEAAGEELAVGALARASRNLNEAEPGIDPRASGRQPKGAVTTSRPAT